MLEFKEKMLEFREKILEFRKKIFELSEKILSLEKFSSFDRLEFSEHRRKIPFGLTGY